MNSIPTFLELKKLSREKATAGSNTYTTFIMGDCATQHLATAIKGYAAYDAISMTVFDADYDMVDALTIDSNSILYTCNPDFVLVYLCTEKLLEKFQNSKDKESFAETEYERIASYWSSISDHIHTSILQFSFVEYSDGVFGNYAFKTTESFLFQVRKLNYLLSVGASSRGNVYIVDLNQIALQFGMGDFLDTRLYYSAKMPVSLKCLPYLAKNTIDVISAIIGKTKKCLITDLDNTLWGGVIGDDGIQGIQIGDLGSGHAFEDLQRWILSLKERGIILCVCSKNDEEVAKEPFIKHPEMVLSLEDISVFVANWEDKATNIRKIQQTLNIGMDSIVFLDDNPFERNLVRSMIPEVTIPELPEDPAMYVNFLRSLNLFETASYSEADKERTKQYQAEMSRVSAQQKFESYDDYLQDLCMTAEVHEFDEFHVPRIAQLTQRSNQFNLRTVRCSEEDIRRLIEDPGFITRYFMLEDKYGSHGLISIVILKEENKDDLFIYNWLMSCRVLKRGMEAFVINTIVDLARSGGYKRVIGEYIKTPKNNMVANIYEEFGFGKIDDTHFELVVDDYLPKGNFIKTE
ncbi:MAG: HAD-IIIC family phosphatase [Tannerellaceae bacterium]|nr:HAD-IIIC family phosphatase [Tannerellaceae bacterium]